jgi:DNA polymerase-3 subunit alpha
MREGENLLPRFEVPQGETEDSWLIKVANAGLSSKLNGQIPAEYQERLNFELDV